MLLCTVLTFALCADPGIAAALTFDALTVPIVWSRQETHGCMGIGQGAGAPGDARIETAVTVDRTPSEDGVYTARVVVRLSDARIELTAYHWRGMSAADRTALRGEYRATLWHEIGHLLTARSSIAAANAGNVVSAPSAAAFRTAVRDRSESAFAQIRTDQDDYDTLAEHGITQDRLPPPLGGADTVVVCSSR